MSNTHSPEEPASEKKPDNNDAANAFLGQPSYQQQAQPPFSYPQQPSPWSPRSPYYYTPPASGSYQNPFYGYPGSSYPGYYPQYNLKSPREIEMAPARVWIILALVSAFVGAIVGATIAGNYFVNDTQQTLIKIETGPPSSPGAPVDIQAVLAKVMPATVSIDAQVPNATQAGTGMIISPNGEILTNNHVIAGALSISVTLYGQSKPLPAQLIGADPTNDVALLQLHGVKNLPTVTFGNPSEIQQGDSVVAIGNALALQGGPSVTSGIISALNRSETLQSDTGQTETLSNLIQTDAPINPGNSGGPLALANGQVIGMNTAAIFSFGISGVSGQNVGFAISIATIKPIITKLLASSGTQTQGTRPVLGVDVTDLTPALIAAHNLAITTGAYVVSVFPGSPAQQAGIRPGDVIVELANQQIGNISDLTNILLALHPGETVSVKVFRDDNFITLRVTLGSAAP